MTTEALIEALLATGKMNEDTTADLGRMLAEYKAGTLHADDAEYVAALYARTMGDDAPPSIEEPIADTLRLDGLTIGEWRDRALAAEEEVAMLRDQATT